MDYKELFELINKLPHGCLKDLSEAIQKNKEANPNGVSYEETKAQIEKFKKNLTNEEK